MYYHWQLKARNKIVPNTIFPSFVFFFAHTGLLLFDQAWKHTFMFEPQKVFFWQMVEPMGHWLNMMVETLKIINNAEMY